MAGRSSYSSAARCTALTGDLIIMRHHIAAAAKVPVCGANETTFFPRSCHFAKRPSDPQKGIPANEADPLNLDQINFRFRWLR